MRYQATGRRSDGATKGKGQGAPLFPGRSSHGMIFVIAMGIIVILSGMLLVFARSMRTEALASANRLSALKAQAIEQGAERWVLAQVDQNSSDPTTLTQVSAEAIQVGDGYFWILRFNSDSDQSYDFGITDESTKVNLNTAQSDALMEVPGMTQDLADAIVTWRSNPGEASGQGAESDYYESLPDPYEAKNSPFETVEELLLVKGITPEVLFGYDLNHNGVIEEQERNAGGMGSMFSSVAQDSRGLFNYVTVYGAPARSSSGGSGAPAAPAAGGGGSGGGSGTGGSAGGGATGGGSGGNRGGGSATPGQGQSGRGGSGGSGGTEPTSMYSADIVAVTADGRAFKRARIVVNGRQPPARIIYRKDLTGLGWPLPDEIRTALRAGQPPPTGLGVPSSGLGTSIGQ